MITEIKKTLNRIYNYKYYICIAILVICAIFNISGSSVAVWKNFVDYGQETGTIIGQPRPIRSDEWAVYLPLLESQVQGDNYFPYISNIVGPEKTDMYIVYGQPVMDISIIFRLFHVGYLIFGIDRGLSIFWVARLLILFLVSIEFMKIFTKNNIALSVVSAVMITLSPVVQWWFAINGLVEMLIYTQLLTIMLIKYMNDTSYRKRLVYLIVIAISVGSFLLTFYPAWEIPFIYVIIALAIWAIKENYRNCIIRKKDIFMIISVIAVFIMLMGYIGIKSKDTISAVISSSYPGARLETGGGMIKEYFKSGMNIFFPFKDFGNETNTCVESLFIDLFPMGLILSLIVLFKEKQKDFALKVLLILDAFLGIFCIFGFPELLAKITMLSASLPKRTIVVASFVNFLLLIRSLSLLKASVGKNKSIIFSIIMAIGITVICKYTYYLYMTKLMMVIMAIMLFTMFYFTFRFKEKHNSKILFSILILFSLISGATVNPIQSGTQVVYDTPLASEIKKINDQDKATWIVEGLSLPMINYPIMMGAKTVNCTNVYPHMNLWEKIDPDANYKDIYDRYSHNVIHLTTDETRFELARKDVVYTYMTLDKLKIMDVKYILTINDLEKFDNNTIKFNKLYQDDLSYKIYEVKYVK